MSSELNLTEDEIAALQQGIADGSIAAGGGMMPDGEVAPFAFGHSDERGFADLHGLHMVNEKLARGLRQVFQPMLRVQPKVTTGSVTLESYEEYSSGFPGFFSINLVRLDPLRGQGMITFEPELIGALVDAYYGGRGDPPANRLSEFTPAEDRIIQALLERMFKTLDASWHDIFALSFKAGSSESHPQYVSYVDGSEMVAVTRFVVHLPRGGTSAVNVVYPLQAIKPLLPLLRAKVTPERRKDDPEWHQRLRETLLDVPLPVRSILAEPVLPLKTVMALKLGDVIPIHVPEQLQMLVDRTPFGIGTPGEANGNAALRIQSVISHARRAKDRIAGDFQ